MLNLDNKCSASIINLPKLIEIKEKQEEVCPVNWALNIVKYARNNACGKSVMCRDGLFQIHIILKNAVSGNGESEDIDLLIDILEAMKVLGCELTVNVAGLISASIEHHRDEWENHIRRKRCNALVCKDYYTIHVDPAKCQGNGECISVCKQNAINGGIGLISVIDNGKCTRCNECISVCPSGAIVKVGAKGLKVPESPIPIGTFEDAAGGGRRRRRG